MAQRGKEEVTEYNAQRANQRNSGPAQCHARLPASARHSRKLRQARTPSFLPPNSACTCTVCPLHRLLDTNLAAAGLWGRSWIGMRSKGTCLLSIARVGIDRQPCRPCMSMAGARRLCWRRRSIRSYAVRVTDLFARAAGCEVLCKTRSRLLEALHAREDMTSEQMRVC